MKKGKIYQTQNLNIHNYNTSRKEDLYIQFNSIYFCLSNPEGAVAHRIQNTSIVFKPVNVHYNTL